MMALIVDRDENTRNALANLLSKLGYGPVLMANTLVKQAYYTARFKGQIELIIASDMNPGQAFADLPIQLWTQSELYLTPLIELVTDPRQRPPTDPSHRIDARLRAPFGLRSLETAISQAHSQRALARNRVVVLGPIPEPQSLARALRNTHWQQVLNTNELERVQEILTHQGYAVGAVVIDPQFAEPGTALWLRRFKRSPLGMVTPVAVLSREPRSIHSFRLTADLFSDAGAKENRCWIALLRNLSFRLQNRWSIRDIIQRGRRALKANQWDQLTKAVKAGLQIDPSRTEFLELAGRLAESRGRQGQAVQLFLQALKDNPCAPMPYLKLIELMNDGEKKEKILQQGALYCPKHPQVQDAIKKAQLNKTM